MNYDDKVSIGKGIQHIRSDGYQQRMEYLRKNQMKCYKSRTK